MKIGENAGRANFAAQIRKVKSINDSLFLISEHVLPHNTFVMGLIVGSEAAVLVDSGIGADGALHSRISQLTDKPIMCALTHCDPDHAGGAALFDKVLINPDEQPAKALPKALDIDARYNLYDRWVKQEDLKEWLKENSLRKEIAGFEPIVDGDVLELGNKRVLAVSVPGHSAGSMCYVDQDNGIAFTGDAITMSPMLGFERCPPLHRYYQALKRFKGIVGSGTALYCGHSTNALPDSLIDDLIRGCEEILAGNTSKDCAATMRIGGYGFDGVGARAHHCGTASIRYNIENIW